MKLIKFQKDWADEFYVYGFWVATDEQWLKYKALAQELDEIGFYFGTNEGWDDWSIDDLLHSDLTVENITDIEAATITRLFGTNAYAVFPDTNFLLDCKEEDNAN